MKYLDFYNTNPKIIKALFGIKLFGDKMPELNANDTNSIKE